jgi:hypothetical protein
MSLLEPFKPAMRKTKRRILIFLILAFIAFLNPSLDQFKDFTGETVVDRGKATSYRRTFNGLLFSIFEKRPLDQRPERYLGIFKNFLKIN